MRVFWRIRNKYGLVVCSRATAAECWRLLRDHVGKPGVPGWTNGPYKVFRVTAKTTPKRSNG